LPQLDQIESLLTVGSGCTVEALDDDGPIDVSAARQDGTLDTIQATQAFGAGATLLFRDIQRYLERFALLCREVERHTGSSCKANVYATPPGGKGFEAHYDTHDVFLLQLEGSKKWTIYGAPVSLPLVGQPHNATEHEPGHVQMEFVLEKGDLLYLPRGVMHEGRAGNDISVHATIGIQVRRWSDAVIEAAARLFLQDPQFRRALPVDIGAPSFDATAASKHLSSLLHRLADAADAAGAINHFAKDFVVARKPLVPGQLRQLAAARALTSGGRFGARPTVIPRLDVEGGQLVILAHGRRLAMSAEVLPAVRFALTQASFALADLPGDLDDETALELMRLLIGEGLVRIIDAT